MGLPAGNRRKALDLLAGVAAVAAVIGLLQQVLGWGLFVPYAIDSRSVTFTKERVFSTFGNPIFFGSFLTVTIPLTAVSLLIHGTPAGGRGAFLSGSLLLQFAGLAVSGSRGAVMGLGAAVAVLAVSAPGMRRAAAGLAGAAVAALLVTGIFSPGIIAHLVVPGDPGRVLMWKTAVHMAASRPMAGWGLGMMAGEYPCAQQAVAKPGDAGLGTNAVYAHNDYLEVAAELGIPAGALFLAVLLGVFAWRGADRVAWAARAGLAAVAVEALVSFPLHVAPTQQMAFMLPALFVLPGPGDREARVPGGRWTALLAGAVLFALGAAMMRPLLRSCYAQFALAYQDAKRPDRAVLYFDRAIGVMGDDSRERLMFRKGKAFFDAGELAAAGAMFQEDIARHPCFPEGYGNLGVVYGVRAMQGERGAMEKALEQVGRALALRPGGKEATGDYNSMGNLMVIAGRRREAIDHYMKALEYDPGSAEAALNSARLLGSLGRRAEAADVVRKALANGARDPELWGLATRLGVNP
jgi:Flp pilus assembly protein TadD